MVAVEQRWSLEIYGRLLHGLGCGGSSIKVHSCWVVVCSEAFRGPANHELCCVDVIERTQKWNYCSQKWRVFLLKEVQTTVKSVQRREMRNCIQRTKWRSRLKVDRLDIVKCWLDCEAWSMTCQSKWIWIKRKLIDLLVLLFFILKGREILIVINVVVSMFCWRGLYIVWCYQVKRCRQY